MILNYWQCPDLQYAVTKTLQKFVIETGLDSRAINTENLVIEGHPFFQEGAKSKTDSLFPRVGVELDKEIPTEDLGMNHSPIQLVTANVKAKLQRILERDSKESEYEYLDSKRINEFLSSANYVEKFTGHSSMDLTISGWAVGNAAEKTHYFIWQAIDSIIPFTLHSLSKEYGISITKESSTFNIRNFQFADNAFGFEIVLKSRQLKETFRVLDTYQKPLKLDVYFNTGKSEIDLK
ncbi:MAG: hypothetical protein KDK36_11005 [Leptospiraceae bacterium]|nr:hypothetical protein [Leptospiraceae bacterium]